MKKEQSSIAFAEEGLLPRGAHTTVFRAPNPPRKEVPARHQESRSEAKMSILQRDIVSVLAYFDVFDHPLRISEVFQFLPLRGVTQDAVEAACSTEPLKSRLSNVDDFFLLKSRSDRIVAERRMKERRARRLWRAAVVMSHIIKRFPFVRGVFVSGELSKGVASKRSDIDFFIVTAENRIWICRTMFAIFKKLFLFDRKKFFCYNLIASEGNLQIQERCVYTAIEVVTVKPLFNEDLFEKFIRANSWVFQYLPNSRRRTTASTKPTAATFLVEKIFNALIPSQKLDTLDRWLLGKWKSIWKNRYNALSSGALERQFQCRQNLSTAYGGDFLRKVMDKYCQRLVQYGIDHSNQFLA